MTQWTRRRVEDTRPSGGDVVNVPNAARGSEKITQEKNSSSVVRICVCVILERTLAA